VVDIRAHGREHTDPLEIAGSLPEAFGHGITVDHQHLAAEAGLAEQFGQRFGLGILELQAVDNHQAVLRLARKRHLEAERANLLVQRNAEVALARTMCLAATDEDRGFAIAMTSGAAALLL